MSIEAPIRPVVKPPKATKELAKGFKALLRPMDQKGLSSLKAPPRELTSSLQVWLLF